MGCARHLDSAGSGARPTFPNGRDLHACDADNVRPGGNHLRSAGSAGTSPAGRARMAPLISGSLSGDPARMSATTLWLAKRAGR